MALVLSACAAPSFLYVNPMGDGIAKLSGSSKSAPDLSESYSIRGIDGHTIHWNWHFTKRIDGGYHLTPGPHKVIVYASVRRGGAFGSYLPFNAVIEMTAEAGRKYRITGQSDFASDTFDLWEEDVESGAKVSPVVRRLLSQNDAAPTVVSYPIYIKMR